MTESQALQLRPGQSVTVAETKTTPEETKTTQRRATVASVSPDGRFVRYRHGKTKRSVSIARAADVSPYWKAKP